MVPSGQALNESRFSAAEPFNRNLQPQTGTLSSDMSTWDLPLRWNLPPTHILKNRFKDDKLDKMWKLGHQVSEFDGDYQDYSSWASTFYDLIHIQSIPLSLKFNHLSQKLHKSIRGMVVKGLKANWDDYITALKRMKRYFGGAQRQAQSAFSTLETKDKIKVHDWKSAREMINVIESYIGSEPEDLRPESQQNTSLMFLIRRRFPSEWFTKYKTWLSEKNWNMVPASFIMWAHTFVESQVEISEWHAKEAKRNQFKRGTSNLRFENMPIEQESQPPRHDSSFENKSEEQGGHILLNHGEVCAKCTSSSHNLKSCEDFHFLTLDERKQFIIEHNRCLLCFGTSHRADTCYSSNKCRFCFKRHHSLVHTRVVKNACNLQHMTRDESSSDSDTEFVGYSNFSHFMSDKKEEQGSKESGISPLVTDVPHFIHMG